MAGAYPAQSSGGIGALLRTIQEQKNQSPLAAPPSTESGSPIRNLVQAPLQQVEAPESAQTVAVRPEVSPSSAQQVLPGDSNITTAAPGGASAAGAAGGVIHANEPTAPAPAQPGAAPQSPAGPSQAPSQPGTVNARPTQLGSSPQPASPRLATSVMPMAMPKPMSPSNPTVAKPTPTPTPSQSSQGFHMPGMQSYGGAPILRTAENAVTEELPKLGEEALGGLASKVLPFAKFLNPVTDAYAGLQLANGITNKLGLGSWFNPRKAS